MAGIFFVEIISFSACSILAQWLALKAWGRRGLRRAIIGYLLISLIIIGVFFPFLLFRSVIVDGDSLVLFLYWLITAANLILSFAISLLSAAMLAGRHHTHTES